MMSAITKIVVHRSENRKKCSVEPLRKRKEFEFYSFPLKKNIELENYIRLGIGGTELGPEDSTRGLLILDSTWHHVKEMEMAFSHVPVRSISGWVTAYPRYSKIFDDPAAGLATIEAIYAAHLILGKNTDGILDRYYWREQFLHLNRNVPRIA